METVDAVVIGAGVVGLAVGRALAQQGQEVVVLEQETAIGMGTSSRNSEVIHAGIYYPPGSLKASLCVQGRAALYAYCEHRQIAHRRCGKLIVATSAAQQAQLRATLEAGRANGVHDLEWLDGADAVRLEPSLRCVAAVRSPSTGIVDSHALMLALQADLEQAGGVVALASRVVDGRCEHGRTVLNVQADGSVVALSARVVVNAAGLWAPAVASRLAGLAPSKVPQAHFAKGSYYALTGPAPFSHLIYPVPEAAGLGVHLTLDLAGQARFGPDVEWVRPDDQGRLDYRVDASRAQAFYAEIRRYWPALPDGALQPAYSGIRPKIQAPGEPARDFMISGPRDHGVPGLVNLFGIESPGLTSALALADHVTGLLR